MMNSNVTDLQAQLEHVAKERDDTNRMLWLVMGDTEHIITRNALIDIPPHCPIERIPLDDGDGFVLRRARESLRED